MTLVGSPVFQVKISEGEGAGPAVEVEGWVLRGTESVEVRSSAYLATLKGQFVPQVTPGGSGKEFSSKVNQRREVFSEWKSSSLLFSSGSHGMSRDFKLNFRIGDFYGGGGEGSVHLNRGTL